MKSILLVDDADLTRDAYALLLEWAGFSILVAGNGREACEVAWAKSPDLIVMDLNMPVLNGWEAARALKADPRSAHIPLIAVSGWRMSAGELSRTRECGFSAVWTKPLPPSRLLEGVRLHVDTEMHMA